MFFQKLYWQMPNLHLIWTHFFLKIDYVIFQFQFSWFFLWKKNRLYCGMHHFICILILLCFRYIFHEYGLCTICFPFSFLIYFICWLNVIMFAYTFFLCCLPLFLSLTTVSKFVFSESQNLSAQMVVNLFI